MIRSTRTLALTLLLALLAGGWTLLSTAVAQEPTELLFWDADWGPDSEAMDELVARFNESHPDIHVVREQHPNTAIRDVLRTSLSAGEGPDVVNYDTGPGFAGVLAQADLLLPLDDAYDARDWDERFFDIARERTTFGGVTYGIGHELELVGVFYNQRIFDELGLEVPETHAEMMGLCEELRSAGYAPIAFGNQVKWTAGHTFSTFAGNIVGPERLAGAVSGEVAWTEPGLVEAIATPFVTMREAGCFNDGINGVSYDDANLLFYSGQAAMSLTGTWMVPDYSNPEVMPDPVGFFFYPSVDGAPIAPPTGLGSGYFVSASVDDPDAALTFLDYLFSDEAVDVWIEELRRIPPVRGVDASRYDVPELLAFTIDALQNNDQPMGYNIDVLMPSVFVNVMFDGFQEVIGGQRTPEEQAAALQRAIEQAQEEGNVVDITHD